MTNDDKRDLHDAIINFKKVIGSSFFNITEAWNWVKDETGISYNNGTIRNYLKAFKGEAVSKGRSAQWRFKP